MTFFFSDPRIKDYVFVGNPIPPALTVLSYLVFLYVGPKWMKHREAFQLKWVMIVYNFGITLFTVFIFKEVRKHQNIYFIKKKTKSVSVEPIRRYVSDDNKELQLRYNFA